MGVLIASAVMPAAASAQELTVYSSLPLSGPGRGQTRAANDGARQALQEAGGMAAGRAVRLVTLNDATRRAGNWTPERVAANARRVARDGVALIGAFNSGASTIAINGDTSLRTYGLYTIRGKPLRWAGVINAA